MLKNKTAIVTGTSRGLGRIIVETFAKNGANVFSCVRKLDDEFAEHCKALESRYSVRVKPVEFDLTDEDAMKAAVKTIKADNLPIDILVNNAGVVSENRLFNMTSISQMQDIFDVNFFSTMRLTQMISKIMIRQKYGNIVNVTSISAIDGEPGQIEYVASKAALIGATKKLASELGRYNIRVNAVAAGVLNVGVSRSMTDEMKEKMIQKTIMKRLGEGYEIANVIAFLASDLSSYVTGQVIRVDGGM